MTVFASSEFPGAEHEPLSYPGRRPNFSYVYYQQQGHEITARGDTFDELMIDDGNGREVSVDTFLASRNNAPMGERKAVLAVGSNGCPGRLAEKYGEQPDVAMPVLVGTIGDTAVVYSRQLAPYAALPATYLACPGAVSWLSVTMLTEEQLQHMDETEHVGEFYARIPVPGELHVDGGPRIGGLSAYMDRKIMSDDGRPIRLRTFARSGTGWPVLDEAEVLSLALDRAGLLVGEPIADRHRHLRSDEGLRRRLAGFLESEMSTLNVDSLGNLLA